MRYIFACDRMDGGRDYWTGACWSQEREAAKSFSADQVEAAQAEFNRGRGVQVYAEEV